MTLLFFAFDVSVLCGSVLICPSSCQQRGKFVDVVVVVVVVVVVIFVVVVVAVVVCLFFVLFVFFFSFSSKWISLLLLAYWLYHYVFA